MGLELGDTHKVSATISVGKTPFGISVTPDGKHVYVTNGERAMTRLVLHR